MSYRQWTIQAAQLMMQHWIEPHVDTSAVETLVLEKKVDVKNTDLSKLRVKELRKICDDEGIDIKGLTEKDEIVKKIHDKFGIKSEL